MTKRIIYVDSGALGHDSNTGTHYHRSPKKTLAAVSAMGLSAGDEVRIRWGTLFNESFPVKTNGVTYTTYMTGSEFSHPPMLSITGPKTVGMAVSGVENTVTDLDVWHAETGVMVAPTATGNMFTRVRVMDFGFGFVIKGANTTLIDPTIMQGRMVRNTGAKTDAGASAIVLWKEPGHTHTGTRIRGAHIEDAWADALAFEDGDGSCVEIFGGVSDVLVTGLIGLNNKVLCEIGGTPGRNEAVSNVVFSRCLTMGSGGKVLYVNPPEGGFYVPWEGVHIQRGTFIADEYRESPFFLAGNQGDLSTRLRVTDSLIVAAAQIYNGGPGTQLNTIQRRGNVYCRPDGSTNAGVTLTADETFATPAFVNAAARDYRLPLGTARAGVVGALDAALSLQSALTVTGIQRSATTPYEANELSGGHHAVPRWTDMVAIPEKYRREGMRCWVRKTRTLYELQEDKATWLKVRQLTPED